MKMEIWLGRLPVADNTFTLEFSDFSMTKQYMLVIVTHDKDGKETDRKEIGVVNKSDIIRLAKAT
jgi:hypothetical protein